MPETRTKTQPDTEIGMVFPESNRDQGPLEQVRERRIRPVGQHHGGEHGDESGEANAVLGRTDRTLQQAGKRPGVIGEPRNKTVENDAPPGRTKAIRPPRRGRRQR